MMLTSGASAAPPVAIADPGPLIGTPLCPHVPGRLWCLSERTRVIGTGATGLGTEHIEAGAIGPARQIGYTPTDLRAAYQVPATTTTATIAIVDAYNAPDVEHDLGVYRARFGMPACTTANRCFAKVNQDGVTAPLPAEDVHWAGETALDVQMVSAICPSCHILLVEADDDDSAGASNMEKAVQQATQMGAKYVSMSWGGGEYRGETDVDAAYFNAPNVAYVASAGDSNYGTVWPAVNPKVVSVGGTYLLRAANTRGWTEAVWGREDGGTGSGCSSYEARPAWQEIDPIISLCDQRAMNDVSVVADPNSGVLVYQAGDWWIFGGTSVGAPIIAAMYAMAGVSTDASAAPYRHRPAFNDIADGSTNDPDCFDSLCYADTGWDGPTGVGTPIGLDGFGAAPPNTMTVHNPGTVSSYTCTSMTVNVNATDSGNAAISYSATGLPPGISIRPDGLITGAATRAGAYTVTVTATDDTGATAHMTFYWAVRLHRIVTGSTPQRLSLNRPGGYGHRRLDAGLAIQL